MKKAVEGVKCVLHGSKDSIFGIWSVYLLARRSEPIRKQILQCFLLNGIILWLSILLFDFVFLPLIQFVASVLYSAVGDPSESGSLVWLGTILWYVFTGFWVLPIFWISKPINSIWYQDIASAAFEETKKQEIKRAKKKPSSYSLGQSISRFIADLLFSLVLELFFLIQSTLVSLLPGVGFLLSVLHMAMLYALYTFEYKWINEGWIVHQRIAYIEKNWPYFLGFGLPLAILTSLTSSLFISACIFGVLFPLFLVSANYATPIPSPLSPVPVFKVVVLLSNKLFSRGPGISSLSHSSRAPSTTHPSPSPPSPRARHTGHTPHHSSSSRSDPAYRSSSSRTWNVDSGAQRGVHHMHRQSRPVQ